MFVDSHAHGDPDSLQGSPRAYVDACRERGIEAIVLIEPLERCLRAVQRFGDFVIPVARIDIDTAGSPQVRECIEAGCRGIKFIGPAAPYGDERYWPLYKSLEALGALAVFHTGYLGMQGREERPVWMEYMRAAQIEVISRRFPDLKILMAHFSNPWWEEAWKVSWTKPNVFADLSGGTTIHHSTLMWAEMFAPDGQLLVTSIRKLCFGTDVPYFRPNEFPFEPYIAFYRRIFQRIALPSDLESAVARGNTRMLTGLDPTQPDRFHGG